VSKAILTIRAERHEEATGKHHSEWNRLAEPVAHSNYTLNMTYCVDDGLCGLFCLRGTLIVTMPSRTAT
jgi:hypothetical protein